MTDNCHQDHVAQLQAQQQANYAACRKALQLPQAIAMTLLVSALAIATFAACIGILVAMIRLAALAPANYFIPILLAYGLTFFLTAGLLALYAPSIELYFLRRRGTPRRR